MTTSAPPDAAAEAVEPELEVHVLNAGYGESIVIHTPDGRWGVVDCYASAVEDPGSNPTLLFLQTRGVTELEFICLTHPHDDHYRGILHLFEALRVRSFWRFGAVSPKQLYLYLSHSAAQRRYDADRERGEKSADTFLALMRHVQERLDRRDLSVEHLSGIKQLDHRDIPRAGTGETVAFDIYGIAPSSTHVEQYQAELRRCLGDDGVLKETFPPLRHNDVSAALVLRYGSTTITLGGDVERAGWEEVLSKPACPALRSHAVKVSHHGSRTGYCAGLWSRLSPAGLSAAIIPPSERHRLPTRDAVEHIQAHAGQVLATCRSAVWFRASEPADAPSNPPDPIQSLFRMVLQDYRSIRPHTLGVCSVVCGSDGSCHITLTGAAGPIRV